MSKRFSHVTVALAVGAGLLGAAPAGAAGWTVQGVQGASCTVDHRTTATWEYRGRKLVNTGTSAFDIVVAVCPISLFAPGVEPREYRIDMKDPERRDAWCASYQASGAFVRTQWSNWSASAPFSGSLGYPLGWSGGLVEATFHCLLHPGASLDRIEIVWYQP